MSVDLSGWLAQVDPADLLPARRSAEALGVERPLALVGSAWLGDAHGYALVRDARDVTYGVPLVVGPDGPRRAVAGDGTAAALVSALSRLSRNMGETTTAAAIDRRVVSSVPVGSTLESAGLVAEVFATQVADPVESAIDVDQTNDLVVVGGAVDGDATAVVKWDLHPVAGDQAGPARLAALAQAGFAGTPHTWALVGFEAEGERFHVATVSDHVPGALDGWDWAVDDVRALARHGDPGIDDAVAAVARLVAELHAALAGAGVSAATQDDADRWVAQARQLVEAADLDADRGSVVERLVEPLRDCAGTPVIAIHGDLHVGQILRAGEPVRYLVIDFDGSPTDTAAERLCRQPAARDVASMLASWDHVGRVVLHRTDDLDEAARQRVLEWVERSQRGFLGTYTDTLAAAGRTDLLDARLLAPFQALQECREYAYAHRYLPHWRYVPDAALPALLARQEVDPR